MDLSRNGDLLEAVLNQLIDEEALGVCFEMHRAVRLDYYELLYPDDSEGKPPYCPDLVNVKGLDIFGNAPNSMKKPVDCVCPNCSRTLGAQKFAPHLEKCMGMGRNSSRLATKKNKALADSEQEGSDDCEEEWTYPEKKPFPMQGKKQPKKFGASGNSPKPSAAAGAKPSSSKQPKEGGIDSIQLKPYIQQHNVDTFASLSLDSKQTLLQQICGVVSERTGRLCTRSVNCPQHSEEQRQDVRKRLLAAQEQDSTDLLMMSSPLKRSRDRLEATDVEPYQELSEYNSVMSEDPLEGIQRREPGEEEGRDLSSPEKTPHRKIIKVEKPKKLGVGPRKLGVGPTLPSSLFSSQGTTF